MTAKQLETYLELDKSVTKETLHKLHKNKQLSSDYHFSQQQTSEIIEIFGGIHTIVDICLSSNELKLSNMNKLNTLQQIIDTNPSVSIDIVPHIKDEYVFDINETFLHSIFGQTKADKMRRIVEHKITLALLAITGIVALILSYVFGDSHMIYNIYSIILLCICWMPWFILKHTLFNKPAFILCLKSFDYWIKVGYVILMIISDFFHLHQPGHRDVLLVIQQCLLGVFTVLGISIISCLDAFNMSKTKKLILCGFSVLLFTAMSIQYQFLVSDESDYEVRIPLKDGSVHTISMISVMSNALKVICIFLWKQTINTFRRKDKAVTLSKAPMITWIDSNENIENKSEEINRI